MWTLIVFCLVGGAMYMGWQTMVTDSKYRLPVEYWMDSCVFGLFAGDYQYPSKIKYQRVLGFVSENFFPFIEDYPKFVEAYKVDKDEYDKACDVRNKWIAEMLAEEPARELLRKEPAKPWLRKQNRLPCSVADMPHCRNFYDED